MKQNNKNMMMMGRPGCFDYRGNDRGKWLNYSLDER